MINWSDIDTVFLDMDGTLLDLNFDNHFWQEHVPLRYAELNHISVQEAKHELYPLFRNVEGTMSWYCLDYWTDKLSMDIAGLKYEIDHLIAVHPYVLEFLDALRRSDKRTLLVTNAHQKSLALKMERTRLEGHFDQLICAHDFGVPKEDASFWTRLHQRVPFAPARTLLVDDSLPVLRSAKNHGIAHLLAVHKPDTQRPPKDVGEFEAIRDFREIMPG
ncbi:MAG TPA: GMP/IMP nucleotidase [Gammaproteobacteria bacterium]|nr:GMP/IMP nucleotidase [Gammaproteobacteria bacterium]